MVASEAVEVEVNKAEGEVSTTILYLGPKGCMRIISLYFAFSKNVSRACVSMYVCMCVN